MLLTDIQKKVAREEAKYLQSYLEYASRIKKVAGRILQDPGLRVLVFGSVVKGQAIPGKSDVDILIVSRRIPRKAKRQAELRARILKEIGDPLAPFEIHLATPRLFEKWYKKRIDAYAEP